jgi:hypothetical protein
MFMCTVFSAISLLERAAQSPAVQGKPRLFQKASLDIKKMLAENGQA